jgi:hypothetical protein
MQRKFAGQFDALTKQGSRYCNQERFRPLRDKGKPLWEFKEHDHRLYCLRIAKQESVLAVLFSGWIKDKKGKGREEAREIEKAKSLYEEFQREYPRGIL